MSNEKSWTALSEELSDQEACDLTYLAGNWNTEIEITITNLSVIYPGPIIHKFDKSKV